MKNYTVKLYEKNDFQVWNAFIGSAKNATFLFHRDFMEYHSDRFQDYSMMVFEEGKLVSVIPTNKVENKVFSHQGLTYGGFVFGESLSIDEINNIVTVVLEFLKNNEVVEFVIKEIISIYNGLGDFTSILKLNGFEVFTSKTNLAVDFKSDFKISKSKLKHFKRISSIGLEIKKEDDLSAFWNLVLIPRLQQKFNSKPVHSIDEITFLKEKFANNIFQYNVYLEDEILAGITIFKTDKVVKSQYGAITESGEKYRALDYLYINLINEYSNKFDFFDMGTVDDDSELGYNVGLLNQKRELGCVVFEQNFYRLIL